MMQDNTTNILIGVIGFVVIVIGIFFFTRKKSISIESIKQESLSMKEVIGFFQQTEILKQLQENSNLLAVVVREKLDNGDIALTLTCYDKEKEKIAHSPYTKQYVVKNMDSDLIQNFGNKDMLVLE